MSKVKVKPKRMFLTNGPKVDSNEKKRGRPSLLGKELDLALLNHLIQVSFSLCSFTG